MALRMVHLILFQMELRSYSPADELLQVLLPNMKVTCTIIQTLAAHTLITILFRVF